MGKRVSNSRMEKHTVSGVVRLAIAKVLQLFEGQQTGVQLYLAQFFRGDCGFQFQAVHSLNGRDPLPLFVVRMFYDPVKLPGVVSQPSAVLGAEGKPLFSAFIPR